MSCIICRHLTLLDPKSPYKAPPAGGIQILETSLSRGIFTAERSGIASEFDTEFSLQDTRDRGPTTNELACLGLPDLTSTMIHAYRGLAVEEDADEAFPCNFGLGIRDRNVGLCTASVRRSCEANERAPRAMIHPSIKQSALVSLSNRALLTRH